MRIHDEQRRGAVGAAHPQLQLRGGRSGAGACRPAHQPRGGNGLRFAGHRAHCRLRRPIAALFLDPACAAYAIAADGLPLFAASALFFALNVVFIGYYQSLERSARATLFMLLRGIVLLVPAFLVLPALLGSRGAWLAIPCAEALTLLLMVADHLLCRRR